MSNPKEAAAIRALKPQPTPVEDEMNCTHCEKPITKGQPYSRTKRGAHHFRRDQCGPEISPEDYVAWCRYTENGSIETCDSDAPKAFKVYRGPRQVPEETVSSPANQSWLAERKKQDPLNPQPIGEAETPAPQTPMVVGFGDWCDAKGILPSMGMVEIYASDMVRRSSVTPTPTRRNPSDLDKLIIAAQELLLHDGGPGSENYDAAAIYRARRDMQSAFGFRCPRCGETLPHLYDENCTDYRAGVEQRSPEGTRDDLL